MGALFDACCPRCRRRYGWAGAPEYRPACPHCGYREDPNVLDRDARMFHEFRDLLAEHPLSRRNRSIRVRQRQSAGLAKVHAILLLGITMDELEAIENYAADPLPHVQARMIQVYALDPTQGDLKQTH